MNNNVNANEGVGDRNADRNRDRDYQVRQTTLALLPLTDIQQIPAHLLQNLPRPRSVTFTMNVRQLVSNEPFSQVTHSPC
jgi:hypothetical protein